MLSSIETPPDPSCSSDLAALKSHEKAPETIAFEEAERVELEENPTSKFSIRNYVLASRRRSCIETSWPFSQQFLQICMKHGVKNLLPPFEPPDLVRSQCLRKSEQLIVEPEAEAEVDPIEPRNVGAIIWKTSDIRLESPLLLKEFDSNSSDPAIESTSEAEISPLDEGTNSDELIQHDHDAELICSVADSTEASPDFDSLVPRQKLEKLQKPLEKKCRLKVKLGVISEINKEGNTLDNSGSVSDPMASKICPVCKAFSSSSNTTLNAHIDQCLSMDSNVKGISGEVPKIKAKQRKKRLMTEIYMTAPRATLEDLDRRNGTNWAVELALLATPTSGVANETKRPKMSATECLENGNDSAVYVDSKGMKLGILSKINEPAPDDLNMWKNAIAEPGNCILQRKKKDLALKHLKDTKMKAQKRKLLFKQSKTQFAATFDDDDQSAVHQQDHVQPAALHTEKQVESTAPATSKPWVCSIQSDIPINVPKSRSESVDNTTLVHRSILAENHQWNSSAVSSEANKFFRSSEVLTGSPKMKRVDCLYNDNRLTNDMKGKSSEIPISNHKWSSRGACSTIGLLKSSKPSDKFLSSGKKPVAIDLGICKKSNKCLNTLQSPLEEEAIFTSKKEILVKRPYFHLEGSKGESNEKALKTFKFRKHRSALRTCKRGPPFLLPNDGVHGTTNNLIVRRNRAVHNHEFGSLNNFTNNHEFPIRGNNTESERPGLSKTVEEREHNNLIHPAIPRCNNSQVEDSDALVEDQSHGAPGEAGGDHVSNDFVNSDKLEISFRNKSCSSRHAVGKVHVDNFEKRSGQQEFICNDVSCEDVEYEDIQMEVATVDKDVEVSCAVLLKKYQAETTSAQDSIGCLTSHGGMELKVPSKSPSMTSLISAENHHRHLHLDTGQSGSPTSAGSYVSLMPYEGSRSKDPEPELSMRSFESQTAELTENTEQRNFNSREHKKDDLAETTPKKCLNEKPFCCSCRESISKDLQLPSHNETSRTTKENRVSNLFIGPRISSSFKTYQSPRSNSISKSSQQSNYNNSIDFSGSYGSYTDLGSPSPQSLNQSSSNPVLRLMGKNLMVVNNEPLMYPQTIAPDHTPYVNSVSTGFASINHLMQQDSSYHCHQPIVGSQAIHHALLTGDPTVFPHLPTIAMGNTARAPLHPAWTIKPDQHMQQTPFQRHGSCSPYAMNEVIVIDDRCSQHENELKGSLKNTTNTSLLSAYGPSALAPRPFACFPLESQNRNVSGRPSALFANFQPVTNASFMNQRFSTQSQGALIPYPNFQAPASSRMGPSFYYPAILR
ncbi:uncharacterized protein LOC122028873 isoform X1 [Zingiber officinale]|uniref:UBZ4-type domain-containing protein n=1 Tax=Zingiber officinale TaxID=94328 RepID=A0A8J5CED0_ZINOF|nr:uncharacterized protein LOC122028873 isoform X1 [Zingiber officinale]XP_042443749.1 uncharacterized protein LOC122028873 isoform X1 [Zingiber officinale]KAG6472787.1 hypothetical protein ZIOFF_070265 [Zingiber officinale]